MRVYLCVILLYIASIYEVNASTVDYRQTIIKAGYGVNFELDGHVLIDNGISFYQHSWIIKWPKLTPFMIPLFNCSMLTDWSLQCHFINRYISDVNQDAYYKITEYQRHLDEARHITLMPNIRKKRSTDSAWVAENLPNYLHSDHTDAFSKFMLLPSHLRSKIFSSLTGLPGESEMESLEKHLRYIGSVRYENIKGIKTFDDDVSALQTLSYKEIDDLYSLVSHVQIELSKTINSTEDMYKAEQNKLQYFYRHLNYTFEIDDLLIAKVLPTVLNYKLRIFYINDFVKRFIKGVVQLTHGYVSPLLIPEKDINIMIKHVAKTYLSTTTYADYQLPSQSSSFYYALKKATFSHIPHGNSSLLVASLRIPLYKIGGLLPIYRINTYPVPVESGFLKTTKKRSQGFTFLNNMPEYIAISDNEEVFAEFDKKLFLSCTGDLNSKVCGFGLNALSRRLGKTGSCAFSIFTEHTEQINKFCNFQYTDTSLWHPHGSAIQIIADSTFLMHASQSSYAFDKWRLICPQATISPSTPLKTCDMCRIKIPCGCVLSGNDFYLPARYSGCEIVSQKGKESVTYLYHVNTAIMTKLFTDNDVSDLMSYEYMINKLHPPLVLPRINFTKPGFETFIDISDTFGAELNKILNRTKENITAYITKEDAALDRVRNFSDQISSRTANMYDVFDSLLSIFGKDVHIALAVIFSPLFLVCFACILSLLEFVPKVRSHLKRQKHLKLIYKYTPATNMYQYS